MYHGHRYTPERLVSVPGNNGGSVVTSKQFKLYIEIISNFIRDIRERTDIEIYNATNMGAVIGGTTVIDPTDIDKLLLPRRFDFEKTIEWEFQSSARPRMNDVIAACQAVDSELSNVEKLAQQATEIVSKFIGQDDTTRAQKLFARLDTIDASIKDNPNAERLLAGATKAISMHIQSQRLNTTSRENASLSHNDIMDTSKILYNHIGGAASWLRGLFEKTVFTNEQKDT